MAKSLNYETKDIRTKDGKLRFGHIHQDQVKSSVMIQAQKGLDYITIDQTAPRDGWITSRCRGRYQVKCGELIPKGQPAMYFDATNGDIIFRTGGRILMEAENIHMEAHGSDNKNGIISLRSNEQILLDSKKVEANGAELVSIYSGAELKLTGINIMKMYSASIQKLTAASAIKPPGVVFASDLTKQSLGSSK
jgi:hypothetical protein